MFTVLDVDGLAGNLPHASIRDTTLGWDGRVGVTGLLFQPLLRVQGALKVGAGEVDDLLRRLAGRAQVDQHSRGVRPRPTHFHHA